MKIIERPDIASELLRKAKEHKPKRAIGWHATDHTKCLRKTVFSVITERELLDTGDEGTALLLIRGEGLGMFFAENQEEWRFWSPKFGWCSIDRPWEDTGWPGGKAPMELKSTRMSSAYPITEEGSATVSYINQVLTYLVKALKDLGVDLATLPEDHYSCYLYVLYEMGDWTVRKPDHRAFEIQVTPNEIVQWDAELQKRHEYLVDSVTKLTELVETNPEFALQVERLADYLPAYTDLEPLLPPVSEHYSWECEQYGKCAIKELISCPGNAHNGTWGLKFPVEESYTREHRERKRRK